MTLSRPPQWLVLGLCLGAGGICTAIAACSSSREDDAGSSSVALHGTTTTDTTYPSVAVLYPIGCSAVRVGPYTYMTASHCVFDYAQGCVASRSVMKDWRVKLSRSGNAHDPDAGDATYFVVTGVSVHPRTYMTDLGACVSTDTDSCANRAIPPGGSVDGSTRKSETIGLNPASDIALLYVNQRAEERYPPGLAPPPMPVLTRLGLAAYPTPYSLHANVSASFDSPLDVHVAGFGQNDLGVSLTRFSGTMRLQPTGAWNALSTYSIRDCNDTLVTALNPTRMLNLQRTDPNGVIIDHGDSGSPAMVRGGTGTGQVAGLSTGTEYVIGVASIGVGPHEYCEGPHPVDGGMACTAGYAPTYEPINGEWLDQRLVDFDGDGFKDWEDRCPTVASSTNADSNADAEYQLAIRANIWPYADTHTPTVTDWTNDPGYVDRWHYVFVGDACDNNSTTASQQSYKFENGENTSCDTTVVYQMGGMRSTVGTSGSGCKRLLDTGMASVANIGGPWGPAPDAAGEAQPAYCACALGTPQACDNLQNQCVLADDTTFPYPSANSGLWQKATRRTSGVDAAYAPYALTFQDPSWNNKKFSPFELVKNSWNFRADISQTTASVVFWTHVTSFSPTSPYDSGQIENLSLYDINNHYARVNAISKNGEQSAQVPVNINLFVPIWLQVTRSSSLMVPWVLTTTDAASGQARLLMRDADGTTVVHPTEMTTAGSNVLALVADGAEVLAADDVLPGAIPDSGETAVVVAAGTAKPLGALHAGTAGIIDGALATVTSPSTSVYARSFSSALDTVFSLVDDGGFFLRQQTLSEALRPGGGTVVVASAKVDGIGLENPQAMVWSKSDGVLFVLDAVSDGSRQALRLVRLTLQAEASEVWTLKSDALPSSIYLSSGDGGEVVLTLNVGSDIEVLAMDGTGTPLYSVLRTSAAAAGRAVLNHAGLSMGSMPRLMSGGLGAFGAELVLRKDLTKGACGTSWIRDHVGSEAAILLAKGC